ncbi:MAG TPA: hypothetical protein VIN05_07780 [Roseovarius sp.]
MAQFDLHKLRDIADEGIARHGLRGYARKVGLDVSTMRSLRDGRDMQISKVMEIIAAMGLTLDLRQAGDTAATPDISDTQRSGAETSAHIAIAYHCNAPQPGPAPVFFDAGWLARQGWNVQNLRWIVAPNAASALSVTPGAMCLLDCAQIWPSAQAVWAYLDAGSLNVGYLSRPEPGTLLISGRDPARPTRHLTGPSLDTITPLGRVVWTGSTLPDQS